MAYDLIVVSYGRRAFRSCEAAPKGPPASKGAGFSEAIGKDFVGISSDNAGENPAHRKPKVS